MGLQSLGYFVFLPVVAAVYLHLPHRLQAPFLLLASWAFYLLAAPGLFWVSLGCTCFTYACGLGLAGPHKKACLRLGVIGSLAILGLFKYANALAAPLSAALAGWGLSIQLPALAMPLGISFTTFAAIGYLVDTARGDSPPERSFVYYALFISLFATLTAGPICRAPALLPQLHAEHRFGEARTVDALRLYALGLFKKVAVADVLMLYVRPVLADIPGHGGPALLTALLGYTLYLYFDFAGYSEMARASGLVLGLELPENFKTPFFAANFSGFWARWHISLSSWLQDYLFTPLVWADASRVPLLGRRVQRFSPVFCVFCVFFLSGFWHGNTLPFVVWGFLQGIYRAGEELCHRWLGKPRKKAPAWQLWVKRAGVFALWSLGMAFFAMGSGIGADGPRPVSDALALLRGIFRDWSPARFGAEARAAVFSGFYANSLMAAAWLAFAAFGLALSFWMDWQRFAHHKSAGAERVLAAQPKARRWVLYYLLVLGSFAGLIIQSGGFGGQSFAYAGF